MKKKELNETFTQRQQAEMQSAPVYYMSEPNRDVHSPRWVVMQSILDGWRWLD